VSAAEIKAEVERIATLDLDGLKALWRKRYGTLPALRSVTILRQLLAWRTQAEALGGLDRAAQRLLARKGSSEAEGLHLGIGARLSRNWKGRDIAVIVETGGFRWDNQLFPSLSAAATAIAGSRWNGPRFFGLRGAV
jgi:hypothetical protein